MLDSAMEQRRDRRPGATRSENKPMNRQAEIQLGVRGTAQDSVPVWPAAIGRLSVLCAAVFVLCAVAAVGLLLFAESRLSSAQRQQVFETAGVYP
jgi:hypothetical protein